MIKPIFLAPIYKDYIWGGQRLRQEYNKINTDMEIVAETWEISTNKNGKSLIKNQKDYKYNNLFDVFKDLDIKEKIFGTKCTELNEFPLLVKFIDANKNLSVQVHPDDEYAKKHENSMGKTEMWYVLDCTDNAKLICGMKPVVKQSDIERVIKNNEIKENINYIDIHKGDLIYIPAGTIHAILEGALICEVQQNCDLTYRVYDWDRIDKNGNKRELHIDKAIDVIDVNTNYFIKNIQIKDDKVSNVLVTPYFKVDLINVEQKIILKSSNETFYGMNVLEGNGILTVDNESYKIAKGDSFIIPATLGQFTIEGNLKIINSYV